MTTTEAVALYHKEKRRAAKRDARAIADARVQFNALLERDRARMGRRGVAAQAKPSAHVVNSAKGGHGAQQRRTPEQKTRIGHLGAAAKWATTTPVVPAVPRGADGGCGICGTTTATRYIRGRCTTCYSHVHKTGRERTVRGVPA